MLDLIGIFVLLYARYLIVFELITDKMYLLCAQLLGFATMVIGIYVKVSRFSAWCMYVSMSRWW